METAIQTKLETFQVVEICRRHRGLYFRTTDLSAGYVPERGQTVSFQASPA